MINKEERIVIRRFFTFSRVASPALGQIDIRTINRYLRHLGSIVYRYAKSGYFAEPDSIRGWPVHECERDALTPQMLCPHELPAVQCQVLDFPPKCTVHRNARFLPY